MANNHNDNYYYYYNIKEKAFYLATSLNSNSTFFEESTLIGSAVVKCWELYPCNVVPPGFHDGSFSGRTRPGLATSLVSIIITPK